MITIIDYGAGNILSVVNALKYIGQTPTISGDPDVIAKADKLILPGVGAFGECMKRLRDSGLDESIKESVKKGAPIMGICLGLQLFFDYSEEFGHTDGLGFISGGVKKINAGALKLPHIAWTSVDVNLASRLFKGVNSGEFFYFVHSYCAKATNPADESATAVYGEKFTVAVEKDNVFGTQFHPEKSGAVGLKLLENFVKV